MSEGTTCPICRRTSYHPMDKQEHYCAACHAYYPEVGRELKASELEPRTVVVLVKEGRKMAATVVVEQVSGGAVLFSASPDFGVYEDKRITHLVLGRQGDELRDDDARIYAYRYLGADAPTSGVE